MLLQIRIQVSFGYRLCTFFMVLYLHIFYMFDTSIKNKLKSAKITAKAKHINSKKQLCKFIFKNKCTGNTFTHSVAFSSCSFDVP